MGWLITLVILTLLMLLPLGTGIIYNSDGVIVSVLAGWIRLKVFPAKKKEKKEKEKKSKKKDKAPSKKSAGKKKKKEDGGSILDFLPLVQTALEFLNGFRKKLRINHLDVKITLAGGDPCDLAVNYGRTWAAIGNLMPLLERVLVIQKRNIEAQCDFTAAQTTIYVRADLTITLGRLLWLVIRYGVKIVLNYIKIMNKRKGGAKQ